VEELAEQAGGGAGGMRTVTTYTFDITKGTYPMTVGTDGNGGDGVIVLSYKFQ
jgi:hypothetical protein